MTKNAVRNLVLAGFFLALALALPFLTGQIPTFGSMLLPMHLPVLLCGFLCGWPYGLAIGFIAPLLRSLLFGMPPMMPVAVAMAFELATYGAVAGFLMARMPRKLSSILIGLICSMLAGRLVWGLVSWILYTLLGNPFSWAIFFAGAFAKAALGIAVQLVLIPAVVLAVWKVEERA